MKGEVKDIVLDCLAAVFDLIEAVVADLLIRLPYIVLLWLIYHALVK